MDYLIHLGILIGIYLILTQSLNLNFGVGRLFNLAHIAVYAIGAYTAALLAVNLGWGFWACIGMSMVAGGVFSLLLGLIAIKIDEDYFAIGTLAFSMIVTAILINWKSLTRGVLGIPGIPRPEIWGTALHSNLQFLILVMVSVTLSLGVLYLFFRSGYARSLRAQAENMAAASSLARDVTRVRTISFIVASTFAGMAGAFFAYYLNYIDPSSFAFTEIVFVLTVVVLGRPGSFWGVVLATVFLVLLPEPLRFIEIPPSVLGPVRQLLYASILFGVVYWKRAILFPVQRKI